MKKNIIKKILVCLFTASAVTNINSPVQAIESKEKEIFDFSKANNMNVEFDGNYEIRSVTKVEENKQNIIVEEIAYFSPIKLTRDKINQSDSEFIYSSSFSISMTMQFISTTGSNGKTYYSLTNISGGYERLDKTCQFLDSEINYLIYGLKENGRIVDIEDFYNSGNDTVWYFNVNSDPVYIGGEGDLYRFHACYSYKVAHAGNNHNGTWCLYREE